MAPNTVTTRPETDARPPPPEEIITFPDFGSIANDDENLAAYKRLESPAEPR